jgi:signal transduction histidine kinase
METDRWGRTHTPDAAIAIGLALIQLASAALVGRGISGLDPLAYVLLLGATLSLVARRRAPVAVLLVATACVLGYELRGYPGIVIGLPVLVAVYTAVLAGRWLAALAAATLLILGMVAIGFSQTGGTLTRAAIENWLLLSGWLVASGVIAEVSRQRSAYLRQVEQRAVEAERTREELALRRAGEERLRIARELHDSLTHSISIINVQTGVAVHLARKRGEDVPNALLAIQEAARQAMRELHATLDVLRREEAPDVGLDKLDDLVHRTRSAGLPVTVTVDGERRPLPPSVDRTAYRIVQEALTNVSRHAQAASASVLVVYGTDHLTVQIDDDGRGVSETAQVPGLGLIGMRERATALGGQLRAEARPSGGFSVRAELPVPDRA